MNSASSPKLEWTSLCSLIVSIGFIYATFQQHWWRTDSSFSREKKLQSTSFSSHLELLASKSAKHPLNMTVNSAVTHFTRRTRKNNNETSLGIESESIIRMIG